MDTRRSAELGKIPSGNEASSARTNIDGMSEFDEFIAILIDAFDKDGNSNRKSVILSSLWSRHLCASQQLDSEGSKLKHLGSPAWI